MDTLQPDRSQSPTSGARAKQRDADARADVGDEPRVLHERRDALRLRVGRWLDGLARLVTPRAADGPTSAMSAGRLLCNRYRVQALLGEGSMGQVWRVYDTVRDREVALKTVTRAGPQPDGSRASDASGPDLALILKREFYTMTKLAHANTVEVFDYGALPNGVPYFTMAIVPGRDLSEIIALAGAPIELGAAHRILSGLLGALGFIHSRLYVHCDIKSSNTRVRPDGDAVVMDFGLLHQLGTSAGRMLQGTPAYMAPEVIRGDVLDQRTDLYALGVLAYELFTGALPFRARRTAELLNMHLHRPAPRIGDTRPVPEAVERFVARLLAKQPDDRYRDATDALAAVERLGGPSASRAYRVRDSYLRAPALIGRDDEVEILARAQRALLAGDGRSAFVSARPGVGKTRLLQEFQLQCSMNGVLVAVGRCRRAGGYLAPLAEALATAITGAPYREIADPLATLSAIMPQLGGDAASSPVSTEQVFAALRALLGAISSHTALVVCVEDLQWADPDTIKLLNFIIRETAGTNAMVLGTFRSDEIDRLSAVFHTVDDGTATRIELAPLDADGVRDLIRATVGALDASGLSKALHEATGGNPFFVIETLRSFIEDGQLAIKGTQWALRAPIDELPITGDLGAVVRRRLARLPPELLALCQILAPLGRIIDLEVARAAAGLQERDFFARLEGLRERQFIVESGDGDFGRALLFSHDRIWEHVYEDTDPSERVAIHRAIADALDALGPDAPGRRAMLAEHRALGEQPELAYRQFRAAADEAIARDLFLPATEHLERAAQLAERAELPDRDRALPALWAQIVDISSLANPRLCAVFAERVIERWSERFDVTEQALAFQRRSRQLAERGGFLARRRLRAMWADRRVDPHARDPQELVPAIVTYRGYQAMAYASSGQEAQRAAAVASLMQMAEAPSVFRAAALLCEAFRQVHVARWRELETSSERARSWFERHIERVGFVPKGLRVFHLMSHYFTAFTEASTGRPIDEDILSRGMDAARRYQMIEWEMSFHLPPLIRAVMTGEPDAFSNAYETIKGYLRDLGEPLMTASRLGLFTAIYWLERGEREQSRAIVDDVARWSRRLPHDVWMRRYLAAFEALYAYRWRAPADAAEALDAALAEIEIEIEVDIKIDSANASDGDSAEPDAERRGFRYAVSLLCARADVQRALGDVDGARATAAQALERAQTAVTASPWDHSVALRTMAQLVGLRDTEPSGAGHLGDGAIGEAEDMAAEAREIAETHGQALNRAKAIWVQAQLRRRAGRDADQLFAEACDAFAALRCAELAELVARDRDRRKSRDISAVRPFGEAARP